MAYIEMKHCYKRYQVGDTEIVANRDVNFELKRVNWLLFQVRLVQASQRFLTFLGGMDTNDEGEIWIDGVNIADYKFPPEN